MYPIETTIMPTEFFQIGCDKEMLEKRLVKS